VVDSFGFNDRTWLDQMGHPHTGALRMKERYQRRDFGHLDVEVTLEDPAVYANPWTVKITAPLAPDTELIENVCAENNKSLDHWVGKALTITSAGVRNSDRAASNCSTLILAPHCRQPR